MSRIALVSRRLVSSPQNFFRRARPGSVLVLVVALLMLLALMGTAYITTARGDRFSATQNGFNTEVDLLLQAMISMERQKLLDMPGGPTEPQTGIDDGHIYTAISDSPMLGDRLPTKIAGAPAWRYIAGPATDLTFESPYSWTGGVQQYSVRENLGITSIAVPTSHGPVLYPAFYDVVNDPAASHPFLAASASGEGVADAGLSRLPLGELNGITYYAGVRVMDNNSAVNASTADEPNTTMMPAGQYFPSNVDLGGMLKTTTELAALEAYRQNAGISSLTLINDNSEVIGGYNFISKYDAMWSQLGRRIGNPGYTTDSAGNGAIKYQSLSMADTVALTHKFCLTNLAGSASVLETALAPTLLGGVGTIPAVPSSPYGAEQVSDWFNTNFVYENGGGNRRPLLTARNPVSNVAACRFASTSAKYDAATPYKFGDWVSVGGVSYLALADTLTGVSPVGDARSGYYWQQEPWTNYPVKTSINTGTFGQLWLAFAGVMNDPGGAVPAKSDTAMFRSPLRSTVTVPVAPPADPADPTAPPAGAKLVYPGDNLQAKVNGCAAGDVLFFTPGTYNASGVQLKPGVIYTGGGLGASMIGQASMPPAEVLRLRAALAAVNALALRSTADDVISRTVSLGAGTLSTSPNGPAAGPGNAIIKGPGDIAMEINGGSGTVITGLTFDSGTVHVTGNASVSVQSNYFGNNSGLKVDGAANSHFDSNSFVDKTGTGIYAYPNGGNCTFDSNSFDNVYEPIHLLNGNNISISYNVGQHVTRHFIEVQGGVTNSRIDYNYVDQWLSHIEGGNDSHMALSLPTGEGGNNEAVGNVLINDGQTSGMTVWAKSWLELAGANWKVANNYAKNWGQCVKNQSGPLSGGNNVYVGAGGWGLPGDRSYALNDPSAPPSPGKPAGGATPTPTDPNAPTGSVTSGTYVASIFGVARQPYITEVYANNDSSTTTGYIAIELYNPYDKPIILTNWQLGTIDRAANGLTVTPLVAATLPAQIAAQQRIVLVSTVDPTLVPAGVINAPSAQPGNATAPDQAAPVVVEIPSLTTAFNKELILMRPRRADGTISPPSTDPTNQYDETDLAQRVPVDSYDFTGLPGTSAPGAGIEWHYIRPNDSSQGKAWHFVYPYAYSAGAAGTDAVPKSRLLATECLAYPGANARDLASLGKPDAAPALPEFATKDLPFEVANTGLGGAYPKTPNAFPFGGFARQGDILQTPFIGSYRISLVSSDPAVVPATGTLVELNPITMDAAFADDQKDLDNPAENLGRFCPMHPSDGDHSVDDFTANADPNVRSAYYWARRLFDFVSVHAPSDDYLPNAEIAKQAVAAKNVGPGSMMGVANATPNVRNDEIAATSEDNVGIDGLINLNTAQWRVLASLPFSAASAAQREQIAKAIVLYRDGDASHPAHGPFKSVFDLNAIPAYTDVPALTGLPAFRDSYLSTDAGGFAVASDFQTQFLALNAISNLITTRSDTFTVYIVVQGWRGIGTSSPELVVQRRAAFVADRSGATPTQKKLRVTNAPTF